MSAAARRLRPLRVVHPFPSIVNSALVGALACLASGDPWRAALLAGGMLGMQFAIGASNDVVDRERDALVKPWKPIVSGVLSAGAARAIGLVSLVAGFVFAATSGAVPLALWLAMLSCGLAYNFWLKGTPFGWACFSVAFALLPVYAWHGASGAMPPRLELLVPLAVVTGPVIHLANSLVDVDRDRMSGVETLAIRLGSRRTVLVLAALLCGLYAVAWATLGLSGPTISRIVITVASVVAAIGLALSAQPGERARAAGWTAQVVATALLAWGWLGAI